MGGIAILVMALCRTPGGEGEMAQFDHVTFCLRALKLACTVPVRRAQRTGLHVKWPASCPPCGARYFFAYPQRFPFPSSASAFAPAPPLPLLSAGASFLYDACARRGVSREMRCPSWSSRSSAPLGALRAWNGMTCVCPEGGEET